MTSPRSHSQEGSGAHSPAVHLQSQFALTWPPASTLFTAGGRARPQEVRAQGQVPCLAGLGRTGTSACPVPAVSAASQYVLPPPRASQGARGSCSADAASRRPPSYPGRWVHLHPLYRREHEASSLLPPTSHGLQNFPPPTHRERERLSGAGRAPAGRPRALALRVLVPVLGKPGPCSLPGPQSSGAGCPANSESA